LFNEVNYITASINLAAVHSTKSLLTCKSAAGSDARLIAGRIGREEGHRWLGPACTTSGANNEVAVLLEMVLCVAVAKEKLAAGVAKGCLQSMWTRAASSDGILPGAG